MSEADLSFANTTNRDLYTTQMKQGHMDGLCGLYASFNLLQNLLKFHPSFNSLVFDVLKKHITIDDVLNVTNIYKLKTILLSGIKCCNKIFSKNLRLTIISPSFFIGHRNKLIKLIDNALSFNKTRILIGVTGLIGNHWTVITGVSKDKSRYHILDSGPSNHFTINKKLISTSFIKRYPHKYIYFEHVLIVRESS